MIKGYCVAGEIEKAFDTMETMRRTTSLKPDEIMYNSLLDGCAQANLGDRGLQLVSDMEKEGVAPSNYTLSLLVKLLSRRKLDLAFSIVTDISSRHGFKPNV